MERNDTCYGCNAAVGVFECAGCHEIPMCERCTRRYDSRGWMGYECFCPNPRFEMRPIPSRRTQGWVAACEIAIDITD
jgi:hypothetical protein